MVRIPNEVKPPKTMFLKIRLNEKMWGIVRGTAEMYGITMSEVGRTAITLMLLMGKKVFERRYNKFYRIKR